MAGSLWAYKPSSAAAIVFLVLFSIATIWHILIIYRRRVWYFIPLAVGGGLEMAGYLTRYLNSKNLDSIDLYIEQTLCILVAPALFAASIYMVLGRLMLLLQAEHYSLVRPTWLTKIFVGGDVLSFLIQCGGAGIITNNFNLAKGIILFGLTAQIVFFGLFVTISIVFHWRLMKNPTLASKRLEVGSRINGWRGLMHTIYLASALIFIRSVFRLIEFTGGSDSPMMKTEAYLYVCDATLMFGVLAILLYFHPSEFVTNRKEMMLAQEQEQELV